MKQVKRFPDSVVLQSDSGACIKITEDSYWKVIGILLKTMLTTGKKG